MELFRTVIERSFNTFCNNLFLSTPVRQPNVATFISFKYTLKYYTFWTWKFLILCALFIFSFLLIFHVNSILITSVDERSMTGYRNLISYIYFFLIINKLHPYLILFFMITNIYRLLICNSCMILSRIFFFTFSIIG